VPWPGPAVARFTGAPRESPQEIAAFIRSHRPKDVRAQQDKVAWADGLVLIAPVHFCNFPAVLRGWRPRPGGTAT
jgi:NAD(P)H dehydrogenase (quinone)